MIQVNRIYLIFNRLVTKKFLVDTSGESFETTGTAVSFTSFLVFSGKFCSFIVFTFNY